MMMRIDHADAAVRDLINGITECRHLIGSVFIADAQLIRRVQDHGGILFRLQCPIDLRDEFIQLFDLSAQMHDVNVFRVYVFDVQRVIYAFHPVIEARLIQFHIQVQYPALFTPETDPAPALRDRNRELDQRECLSGLTG